MIKILQKIKTGWTPALTVALITAATIAISVYCLLSGWTIIFQNLFYVPIIIACMYYGKKGFAYSIALSFMYLTLILSFTRDHVVTLQAMTRTIIFVGVAGVVAYLSSMLKHVEEALRESDVQRLAGEEMLQVVYGTPIPTFYIGKNHQVLYWNAALQKYSGIKAENIIGTDRHWQAFYGQKRPCMVDLMVDGQEEQFPQWYPGMFKKSNLVDGGYECTDYFPTLGEGGKWLFITAVTLKDHQGKIIGALETLEDITDRKNSEEVLRKSEEEVRRINESLELRVQERTRELEVATKELEAFSYSVSHDLRAPLRTIDGFGQALLEDCEDKLDAQGKDHLRRIRAATQRMGGLIDDMLKLSRITRAEMNIEKVSLTQIARSVIAELQNGQPGRSAKIIIAEGLEDRADPRLIRIALENLLGNAWKFTGKQPEALIEFGCTAEGGSRTYFVCDNGAGFDMAYVSKLFIPFQRLHSMEEFPGTGIGLGTVQRIIQRHGGKLWAEGQAGKGATFYFTLNG